MTASQISFDETLISVGNGRFQILYFFNILFQLSTPFSTQAKLFLGATLDHFCTPLIFSFESKTTNIPIERLSYSNQNLEFRRFWHFEESPNANGTTAFQTDGQLMEKQ